jgi:hypothetical protein
VQKAVKVLAMSRRGSEPREFKNKKLNELMVLIFMYYIRYRFKKNFNPNPQSLRLFLGFNKALTIDQVIVLLYIALKKALNFFILLVSWIKVLVSEYFFSF